VFDALEVAERIVWESPDGIGVVVFEPEPAKNISTSQKSQADQLRAEVVAKAPGLKIKIGIAELAGNMADFGRCYRQARLAVHSGRKVWPQLEIYHYLDMGVYQLLARFNDEQQINEYIERVLGKLLQYDNKRKGEAFLETLGVILMSDNMKEAAENLAIHYQTLLYRKQRIEKILGISFDDFATKMSLLTALHLLKLRRN
jgi:sugar diacid utilization regulator